MNAKMAQYFLEKDLLKLVSGKGLIAEIPLLHVIDSGVIAVHWYSMTKKELYDFHLCFTLDAINDKLAADPWHFRVMFLGQLKDFPQESEFHAGLVENFQGNMEKWILFAVAPIGLGPDGEGGTIPVSFATEVILLAEGGKRIRPDAYLNLDEWGVAVGKLNPRPRRHHIGHAVETALMDHSRGLPDFMLIEPLGSGEIDG